MKINRRAEKGVTILSPKGKITIGLGDVALREAVLGVLSPGDGDAGGEGGSAAKSPPHILINLGEVTTIDSSGIGELVSAYTTVANRGGKLKLCNLPPKVSDILQITQLVTVLDVYEDEAEAIASFGP